MSRFTLHCLGDELTGESEAAMLNRVPRAPRQGWDALWVEFSSNIEGGIGDSRVGLEIRLQDAAELP